MNNKRSYGYSNLLSFSIHLIILVAFMFLYYEPEQTEDEFVTVGFGTYTRANSSGSQVSETIQDKKPEIEKEAEKKIKKEEKPETKKVELPKAKNDDAELTEKNKKAKDEKTNEVDIDKTPKEEKLPASASADTEKGKGDSGDEEGSAGFEIAWGGSGMRKIYSYELPSYPEGVSKEIDIKLRFAILPDGTVGKIIPLMKADTRLEMAAINSLRNWRFEPLRTGQKKAEQSVVITFPYRLQ